MKENDILNDVANGRTPRESPSVLLCLLQMAEHKISLSATMSAINSRTPRKSPSVPLCLPQIAEYQEYHPQCHYITNATYTTQKAKACLDLQQFSVKPLLSTQVG